jgi:hypothetical protein
VISPKKWGYFLRDGRGMNSIDCPGEKNIYYPVIPHIWGFSDNKHPQGDIYYPFRHLIR